MGDDPWGHLPVRVDEDAASRTERISFILSAADETAPQLPRLTTHACAVALTRRERETTRAAGRLRRAEPRTTVEPTGRHERTRQT